MELIETFKQKLTQGDDALAFFHSLPDSDKSSLKPTLLELTQVYKYAFEERYLFTKQHSEHAIINLCASYVCDYKEFGKHFGGLHNDYYETEYYKTFRPSWLAKELKEYTRFIRYRHLLGLMAFGFEFDEADIINQFVDSSGYRHLKRKRKFDISHFDEYPLALSEHIWLVFTQPSEIHIYDRWRNNHNDKKMTWLLIIENWVNTNKIDRARVLKECLLTSTRNFNKLAVGWFCDLFELLEPTEEEIITLMPELMLVLNGTHTKPINNVLKKFKTLCLHDDFKTDEFLAMSEVLLASDVKAVINNTFAVFEKIAKNQPNKQEALSRLACSALIHSDEKIQTKVAKFVLKYGDITNESLKENIASYYPELFSSVKSLLEPLSLETQAEDESNTDAEFEYTAINRLNEANRISIPTSFDDQIFFITQAFENNEPYHFDVYLAVIIELIPQINTPEKLSRLAPAMKSAMRVMKTTNNRIGYIEQMMAGQFVNLIATLIERIEQDDINTLYQKLTKTKPQWQSAIFGFSYVKEIEDSPMHQSNRIFSELLSHSKQLARNASALPMLSTPSHAPCFIDIASFCSRLQAYIEADKPVNNMDFQIAVSRLCWQETAIEDIKTALACIAGSEFEQILQYLIFDNSLNTKLCQTLPWWAVAVYRKYVDMPAFIKAFNLTQLTELIQPIPWSVKVTYHGYDDDDDVKWRSTYLDTPSSRCGCCTEDCSAEDNSEADCKICTTSTTDEAETVLYHEELASLYTLIPDTDKVLCTSPYNPNVLIEAVLCDHLRYGGINEIDKVYLIKRVFPILMTTWEKDYADFCYVFMAIAMVETAKENRQLASELWVHQIQLNNMDNIRLGQQLGKLEHSEFAPLKRFTDLLSQQLMNISKVHNQALITLISNMIPNMNDKPIKGSKKFLELYLELLTVTKTQLTDLENAQQIQEKLAVWAETKSLKAIVKKLVHKQSF